MFRVRRTLVVWGLVVAWLLALSPALYLGRRFVLAARDPADLGPATLPSWIPPLDRWIACALGIALVKGLTWIHDHYCTLPLPGLPAEGRAS
jgi:hypothetical protein